MYNISGIRTFTAGEALAARRLVKVDASSTIDPPEVEYADAGEDAIGITEYAAANGALVAVKLLNTTGTFEVEVGATVARGALLYAAADGKASGVSSGSPLGVALETGVDGALIEMAFDYRKSTTAAGTTIADAGSYTSESTVEGALQELYGFALAQGIDDPGDVGAIPVTKTGVCPMTTEAAETRTLAIPTFVGQVLTLTLDVDGGNAVVTVAAAVNVTGNDTLTFDNAGETITLIGTEVGGAKVWRVLANDGVGLSTA